MDNMVTVEKEDSADWDELLPTLAVPIRAAQSLSRQPQATERPRLAAQSPP
jgi:hypothetical protein